MILYFIYEIIYFTDTRPLHITFLTVVEESVIVETGWRERNEDDFYESIYFVLCVANVNSELKTALSPKVSETRRLTATFIEFRGRYSVE